MINTFYTGNNIDILKSLPNDYIDLTITSPPYDNLRTYDNIIDDKITYNTFSFDFPQLITQLYRITKQGGVVVWVVNDQTINGSESGNSFRQALSFIDIGFNLHDTMIYQKTGTPFPQKTRYNQTFEYMFVFSKGKPKTFNPLMDRPNVYSGKTGNWGKNNVRQKDGSFKERSKKTISQFGKRYNVWKYKTSKNGQEDNIAYNHPAIFPQQLVEDHILSWSNKGDLILDPFCGSGTVPKMCILNNRDFIAIDINPDYIELSKERCSL